MTQSTPPAEYPLGFRIWKKTTADSWHSPDDWVRPTVEEARKFAEPISKELSSKEIVVAPEEQPKKPPVPAPVQVDFKAMREKWGRFGGPSTSFALFGYGGILKQTYAKASQMVAFHAERAGAASICRAFEAKGINPAPLGIQVPAVWPTTLVVPGDDALIDRSRAMVARQFLETNNEVLFMVDHDIEWNNADINSGYEGDILHLCMLAAETKGIVGGIVSKKVIGEGIASMVGVDINVPLGHDGVFETPVVGSGMTAYHRSVIQDVWDRVREWDCAGTIPAPGYVPVFLPNIAGHPHAPGQMIVNSEDWALCERARRLGHRSYLATRPVTKHWGWYPYEVARDAAPRQNGQAPTQSAPEPVAPPPMGMDHPAIPKQTEPVTFSLCHATRGRPKMALAARELWYDRASGEHNYEYTFSIDDDDSAINRLKIREGTGGIKPVVVSGDNRGCVDAFNRAAWKSTGQILIQVHDDVEPPQDWDLEILKRIQDINAPVLLKVGDGTAPEVNADRPWLPTVAIMTRPFAEKVGGMWYPGYISLYCDDDLGRKAQKDGCFLAADDLVFKHDWQGPTRDETQKRSYSDANREHGEALFRQRTAAGFPDGKWGEVVA